MNRTGLTNQEVDIIEQFMVQHGVVVTMEQIQNLLGDLSPVQIRKRVSQLVRKGWLYRIKRGVYAVCDISQRGSLPLSVYTVSHLLVPESYVSFEGALQHHGMVDQLLSMIRAVALARYNDAEVGGTQYRFITTSEKYFFGWDTYRFDGQQVKIASAEKALIDLIQYHRTTYSVDLVLEVVRDYREDLDYRILYDHLQRTTTAVQRIFGFLYDLAELEDEAQRVHELVRDKKNNSRVTAQSEVFVARWRLYINDHLRRYLLQETDTRAEEIQWTYST